MIIARSAASGYILTLSPRTLIVQEIANNVLLDYGLFPTEPFIVFVEGGTGYDILNAYKRRKAGYDNLGYVNIHGTGNS